MEALGGGLGQIPAAEETVDYLGEDWVSLFKGKNIYFFFLLFLLIRSNVFMSTVFDIFS
jgi:hypothetical protein